MQKIIDLYKWITNLKPTDKLFAILFLIIIAEAYIILINAENYRGDIFYYRNRLDNNTLDCAEKIEKIHNENKAEYRELLQKYKELYNETLKMK